MQKNLWKGLFRPENKKLRSNIFLALLAGVLLLAMGKSFFGGEKEAPAQAETQTASDVAERETETLLAEILSKVRGPGAVDVMLTIAGRRNAPLHRMRYGRNRRGTENSAWSRRRC